MNTSPDTDSYTSSVTAGPVGAMTDEVGVVTGDLAVRTTLTGDGHRACAAVPYPGTDEWYTLTGSPAPSPTEASRPTTATSSDASAAARAPQPPDPALRQASDLTAGRSLAASRWSRIPRAPSATPYGAAEPAAMRTLGILPSG
ncbi:hypothetical protein SHJG_1434 [Streptomyces hygroscopicus subsp. jinggangensis 5008]|nr:hypothetical protein SHJG_1434 [Streptomyces hygroscopicus subsp. jinggangensis 5008]AGF60933.1 hypothetical protein SHJGH_1267 [Streptomyces hygroscopicus subsp. jinggangensis TL01]